MKELYGAEEWVAKAEAARTSATAAYVAELQTAVPVSLVAAAFIIYGALVVGGGKQTQLKARRQPPSRLARTLDASADNHPSRSIPLLHPRSLLNPPRTYSRCARSFLAVSATAASKGLRPV